ncbi:cupredoxin domain-containing protein [Roseimaritima ulvae]|uniref:Uncharacterized protein n=1 Tax=Roseimaritima ulvae TaxID=980254 RepID=A0A5B9QV90_9BACT|nr:hypothetical protein [Roseimaritima ulvae]QEG41720.1 hypothetical protein UC8_37460 [Roseimaritima ulvae]
MRYLFWHLLGTIACVQISAAGDLTLRFQYEGEPPPPKPIKVDRDVAFCGQHGLVDESLLVHPKDGGIKNVVVYVYTGRGGSEIDSVPHQEKTHTLDRKNCRHEPHILLMQAGDTLKITNSDPVGHFAAVSVFNNTPSGLLVPPSQGRTMELPKPEPGPMPVQCVIHPWMQSYVVVLDHPYVGVSDEHGKVAIKDLPDKELVFRVFVEAAKGALDTVTVDGKPQQWTRNRFRYNIKPGNNDMGTVKLTAKHFGQR